MTGLGTLVASSTLARPTEEDGGLWQAVVAGVRHRDDEHRVAFVEEGGSWTFGDVLREATIVAGALGRRGLRAGDRLVITLPDSLDFVAVFLGAIHAGIVPVSINLEVHPTERRALIDRARARAIVSVDAPYPGADHWLEPRTLRHDAGGHAVLAHVPAPDATAYGVFTSGTTGAPKIVLHTHADAVVNAAAVASHLSLRPGERVLSSSRLYFAYGLGNTLLFPLLVGTTSVLSPERLTPVLTRTVFEQTPVEVLFAQPSFVARLLDAGLGPLLSRLRLVVVGGEPVSRALANRLAPYAGASLVEIFGTTEIGHAAIAGDIGRWQPDRTGRALEPYASRVVDERGNDVAPGDTGRLVIVSPTISLGVSHGDQPLSRPGQYETGDLARRVGSDGAVEVIGRLDDIEIVGGQNVHPAEIEDAIRSFDAVADAVVYAVVEPSGESVLQARVVASSDSRLDERALAGEIGRRLRDQLTWYKVPRDVHVVAAIPRTGGGKVDRRALREGRA